MKLACFVYSNITADAEYECFVARYVQCWQFSIPEYYLDWLVCIVAWRTWVKLLEMNMLSAGVILEFLV